MARKKTYHYRSADAKRSPRSKAKTLTRKTQRQVKYGMAVR